jgi:hypothetical protein
MSDTTTATAQPPPAGGADSWIASISHFFTSLLAMVGLGEASPANASPSSDRPEANRTDGNALPGSNAFKIEYIGYAQPSVMLDPSGKMELHFSSGNELRGRASSDRKQFIVEETKHSQADSVRWRKPKAHLAFPIGPDGSIDFTSRISYKSGGIAPATFNLAGEPIEPKTLGDQLADFAKGYEVPLTMQQASAGANQAPAAVSPGRQRPALGK